MEEEINTSFKKLILNDSWWPLSKRIYHHPELGEQSALFFAFLIEKHDYLVEQHLINQGDWFFFLKEDIKEKFDKSITWQDNAVMKLKKIGLLETKLGQGKRRMYRINMKIFKTLL